MAVSSNELSRAISYILRHRPWLYELELDEEGWVPIDALLNALRTTGSLWQTVERADLVTMIEQSSKRRHEIVEDRIRALYGHSIVGRIVRTQATPPTHLYHGTSPAAWESVAVEGLRPMGRQYVHLSFDEATARQVGRRKSPSPVLLVVRAGEAHRAGILFWRGNEAVWLAEHIPPQFLTQVS